MPRTKTKGICTYCKAEIAKNSRSILSHISKCKEQTEPKTQKISPHMIILLEGKYDKDYWMVIKAKSGIKLEKIDDFIRDIWVECCGHLSTFSDSYDEIDMSRKINSVFEIGRKIGYVYDWGSSTELTLSLLKETEEYENKPIEILIRNKNIEIKCSYCDNTAVEICPYCINESEGLLCEECAKTHKCVEEEGDEILMPLVNSPRAGVCGYYGYDIESVAKYFPKEVIE